MITASTAYALCEHLEGRTYRVVRKGSKRSMNSARLAAKRDNPGRASRSFCVFLAPGSEIGDLLC